jgi:hypothetical protein
MGRVADDRLALRLRSLRGRCEERRKRRSRRRRSSTSSSLREAPWPSPAEAELT